MGSFLCLRMCLFWHLGTAFKDNVQSPTIPGNQMVGGSSFPGTFGTTLWTIVNSWYFAFESTWLFYSRFYPLVLYGTMFKDWMCCTEPYSKIESLEYMLVMMTRVRIALYHCRCFPIMDSYTGYVQALWIPSLLLLILQLHFVIVLIGRCCGEREHGNVMG